MTEVLHQAGCPGAGDPFIRWGYDEVGNRLTETRPAGTTTYSYDNADQLTQQSGLGGTVTYGYDANGNQLAKGSRTFTYDLNDRLVSTTAAGTTITYGYDGDGKRLLESDSTSTTRFLWDANQPLPELAIERNGAGTLLRRYHHGLSLISMRNGAGADFYYHPDGLGSTANLTDANGATQWTYEYEPYGAERVATPAPGAPVNRIRYTGAYLDTDTGLYHLRARQYDPTTGRFLATDPLAADVADPYVATYLYADDRPTALTDPSGMSAACVVCNNRYSRRWTLRQPQTRQARAEAALDSLIRFPDQFRGQDFRTVYRWLDRYARRVAGWRVEATRGSGIQFIDPTHRGTDLLPPGVDTSGRGFL